MSSTIFDYAIIGAGAAGLHLAIKLAEDPYFKNRSILIVDKDEKTANDKTWSFWEKETSRWDEIIERKWGKTSFYIQEKELNLNLAPYHYKSIRASRFYQYAKNILEESGRFTWIQDEVLEVSTTTIKCVRDSYEFSHAFDSRMPSAFENKRDQYPGLVQHFLGWFIETKQPVFDPDSFVMMDYRLLWEDQTSFTYVLPFSENKALVEFTLFNNKMLSHADYEQCLKTYIHTYITTGSYSITEVEQGAIPMNVYPFHQHHKPTVSKIGTAGGWVRPSSGYSFKNADRYAAQIIANIKKQRVPHYRIAHNRFRLYDSIFLRVLQDRNDLGPNIFYTLYAKQPLNRTLQFLDEESHVMDDLRIMFSLNQPAFRKALIQSL